MTHLKQAEAKIKLMDSESIRQTLIIVRCRILIFLSIFIKQ